MSTYAEDETQGSPSEYSRSSMTEPKGWRQRRCCLSVVSGGAAQLFSRELVASWVQPTYPHRRAVSATAGQVA